MGVEYSRVNPLEEIEQYVARLPASPGQTVSSSSREHHAAVKGAPTPEFRRTYALLRFVMVRTDFVTENLLDDRKYITTFHDAGWSE